MKNFPTLNSWMMTYYIEPVRYYSGKLFFEFIKAESDMDYRLNAVPAIIWETLREIEDIHVIESNDNIFVFTLLEESEPIN